MSAAGVPLRIAQNGQAYTWEEFLEYYGKAAWKRWCDAEHPDRDRPRFPGPPVVSAMASAATLPSSPYVQAASTLPASPPSPSPAPPAAAAAAPAPAGASAAAADRRPQRSSRRVKIREDVLDPLLAACHWDEGTRTWQIPQTARDPRLLDMDWRNMLNIQTAAGITAATPTFYKDEADPNRGDKPRLDIVVSFADGRSVRYHPRAKPIWSDEVQPTEAMSMRYARARTLDRDASQLAPQRRSSARWS